MVKIVTKVVLELINSGKVNLSEKKDPADSNVITGNALKTIKDRYAFGDKKVICMEDLRGIESGFLEVGRNTVITPLARDYLKEKGIETVYK
ncbi:MAG: hypothetical protein FIA99_05575 [Ruminiclostridium sp.]|nr:hypothetical protein [Ruminiclostridium sp.]